MISGSIVVNDSKLLKPSPVRRENRAEETDRLPFSEALASEWDYQKNGCGPETVSHASAKKVWWCCPKGHSYQAAVFARVNGSTCPYCAGKKVLAGFNDLLTTDPEVCKDWDMEKNSLKPTEVNRGSHKKIWWKCKLGHSYEAEPFARVAGNGCPYCAGRRVLAGYNDLATTHPQIAAQWAQDLNGKLTPQEVSRGFNKKVWWKCAHGHYWKAAIFSRTRKKASDCPVCAGKVKPVDPGAATEIMMKQRKRTKTRENRVSA